MVCIREIRVWFFSASPRLRGSNSQRRVASHQIRHGVDDVRRGIVGIGNEQSCARYDRVAGLVRQRQQRKSGNRVQPPRRGPPAAAARRSRFKTPIHRHKTSVIGLKLTPEFCIEVVSFIPSSDAQKPLEKTMDASRSKPFPLLTSGVTKCYPSMFIDPEP